MCNICESETYSLIRSLVVPEKPSAKSFEASTAIVSKYYKILCYQRLLGGSSLAAVHVSLVGLWQSLLWNCAAIVVCGVL